MQPRRLGQPVQQGNIPTAERPPKSTAPSNVTGIKAGQLKNGRPPMLSGYSRTETQVQRARSRPHRAEERARQRDQRHRRVVVERRLDDRLDRVRGVGVHLRVAHRPGLADGVHEVLWGPERRQDAEERDGVFRFTAYSSWRALASGVSVAHLEDVDGPAGTG